LASRIVTYWCITWLLVFTLTIVARLLLADLSFSVLAGQIISDFWFPVLISVFLIPIVVWDSYRFSNRIAGPIPRINRQLRRMADNEPVELLQIRENDLCHELVHNVNEVIRNFPQQPVAHATRERREPLEAVH
jgi:hypothetical protein